MIFAVYVIYFSFGFYHLTQFETADEYLWHARIPKYWKAVTNQKWSSTYINDKPGVTLEIISGIYYPFLKNKEYKYLTGLLQKSDKIETQKKILFVYRLPILVFNGIFCLFFFWIIRKITNNEWIALWSFTLILLSPILLGISQIVNPDSLLWIFSMATLLSFVALLKTGEKKFIFLTSLFLGLSLLTKYAAVILFPFLFATFVLFLFMRPAERKISSLILHYYLIIAGSLVVFSFLLPAVFSNPKYLLDGTIGYPGMAKIMLAILFFQLFFITDEVMVNGRMLSGIFGFFRRYKKILLKIISFALTTVFLLVIINWNLDRVIFNSDNIIDRSLHELKFFEDSPVGKKLLYQFYLLTFSLTLPVVFSLLFLWSKITYKNLKNEDNAFLITTLSLFIFIYYFALVFENLPATVRYSISLYPIASILAAIGIYEFFSLEKFKKTDKILISLAIIAVSVISLWQIKPFYFNYTNSLLPKKYSIATAWGYGGYEAAEFLNSLPNAEDLVVWSDYYGFAKFFKGKTSKSYIPEKDSKTIDYYVLTSQGRKMYNYWCGQRPNICEKRYVPAKKYYEAQNPFWELNIDGRPENFIKIFKSAD